jgi:hypothetical protein
VLCLVLGWVSSLLLNKQQQRLHLIRGLPERTVGGAPLLLTCACRRSLPQCYCCLPSGDGNMV